MANTGSSLRATSIEFARKAISLALTDPRKALRFARYEANRWCRELNRGLYKLRGRPEGFDLMTRDWDTAIILDACRFDAFAARHRFENGELQRMKSPGTDSLEFIQHSFQGRELHDTVYVTGNPYATVLDSGVFHDIILDEVWDSGNKQAPADRMTSVAKDAHERYPNKRIIVHYMQPHMPVLAPESCRINDEIEWWKHHYWPAETSVNALRKAYINNLDYVLEHAELLIDTIEGKTVVTADHGELLGERQWPIPIRGFNHFSGLYHPKLVEVPWLVLNDNERREVLFEPPESDFSLGEDVKNERLEALGYI